MAQTIVQRVLGRLKEVGVDDFFRVAGDYAFPIDDPIVEHPAINWTGCCNKLNAAYAADGYARRAKRAETGRRRLADLVAAPSSSSAGSWLAIWIAACTANTPAPMWFSPNHVIGHTLTRCCLESF